MNEDNGLPTLPDKSIDLCITDPPYNVCFLPFKNENRGVYEPKFDQDLL